MSGNHAGTVRIGVAKATRPGQKESGDRHFVRAMDRGVLVAVVDGIGHGQEAGVAAQMALKTLEGGDEPSLIAHVRRCHDALRSTRGVVMSVVFISPLDDTITWLGVGNVAGCLLRGEPSGESRDETLLLRAGLLGNQLPPLRAEILTVAPGDVIILATDGIDAEFASAVRRADAPQAIAERILASHYDGSDDAMVVVAKYLGKGQGPGPG